MTPNEFKDILKIRKQLSFGLAKCKELLNKFGNVDDAIKYGKYLNSIQQIKTNL